MIYTIVVGKAFYSRVELRAKFNFIPVFWFLVYALCAVVIIHSRRIAYIVAILITIIVYRSGEFLVCRSSRTGTPGQLRQFRSACLLAPAKTTRRLIPILKRTLKIYLKPNHRQHNIHNSPSKESKRHANNCSGNSFSSSLELIFTAARSHQKHSTIEKHSRPYRDRDTEEQKVHYISCNIVKVTKRAGAALDTVFWDEIFGYCIGENRKRGKSRQKKTRCN